MILLSPVCESSLQFCIRLCVRVTLKVHSHPPHYPSEQIKMSGSESQGKEEAACATSSGLCDHYSELFTWMIGSIGQYTINIITSRY